MYYRSKWQQTWIKALDTDPFDCLSHRLHNQIWEPAAVRQLMAGLHCSDPERELGAPSTSSRVQYQHDNDNDDSTLAPVTPSRTKSADKSHPSSVILNIESRRKDERRKKQNIYTKELRLVINPSSLVESALESLTILDMNGRNAGEHTDWSDGLKTVKNRNALQKYWIQESLLRLCVPDLVMSWENNEKANSIKDRGRKGKTTLASESVARMSTSKLSGKRQAETEATDEEDQKQSKRRKTSRARPSSTVIDLCGNEKVVIDLSNSD